MCLICGKSFCKTFCGNDGQIPKDVDMVTGNLNKHSQECHNGICAFIDTKLGHIVFINYPKNIVLRTVYVNDWGEEFKLSSNVWD